MSYKIGVLVFIDGHFLGSIRHLIIDPRSSQVTHLVISHRGTVERKIVPIDLVDIQTSRAIILPEHVQWDDLKTFHSKFYDTNNGGQHIYTPKVTVHPLYYYPPKDISSNGKQRSEPLPYMRIHIKTPVYDNQNKKCGFITNINSDDKGHVVYVVMQSNQPDDRNIYIPVEQISHVEDGNIILYISYKDLFS